MKVIKQGMVTARVVSSGSAVFLVLAAALVFGPDAALRAQTAELQLVASNTVPQSGTFYSVQLPDFPPLPFNPYPQLDTYSLSNAPGLYWVDDRLVDYDALQQERQMDSALRSLERQYGLDSPDDPPPAPGGWGGGGDDTNLPPVNPYIAYPDGSLWLSIEQLTNGVAPLTIHGTVQDVVYEILSVPTLTNSAWASEGAVLGATNQDWTPVAVTVGERTNSLFFRALIWTDFDGYGTPAAWYLQHGLNPLTPGIATQDADQDGLLNWQEYRYGGDPQSAEGFSVWVSSPAGYSAIP
jgi:hypothetical protein